MNMLIRPLFRTGLLTMALCATRVSAGTLVGSVSDATTGQALPSAVIRVAGLALGTYSAADGTYRIERIPAGIQVIVSSHIGYQTRTDTLELGTGSRRLHLALREASIAVGQLEVTAARSEPPSATQAGALSLSAAQLRQMPAIGEPDLLRSLTLLPGVKTVSDYSSGLYVRGGSPDQNLVLLDQVPIYNPSHAFGFFSTFNPDAVSRVDLYKGSYPVSYGGNLGALLDVSSQGDTPERLSGTAGLSLISGRVSLAGPLARGSWKVAGRRTYLDPLLAAARSAGATVPDYYFYDLNGRVDQRLGGGDTFAASTYLGSDDLQFDLDADNRLAIRWSNRTLGTRWNHLLTPALLGSLALAGSQYESNTALDVFATPVRFTNSVRDLSFKGDLTYTTAGAHTLSGGAQLTRYQLTFAQYFNSRQPDLDLALSPTQAALYLQDRWRPGPLTDLRVGARASYFSAGQRWSLSPRLSLTQVLQPSLRLKLGAGRSVQYLQLVSTEGFSGGDFWVPLDGTVKPSRSQQVSLGMEWEPSPAYQVSLEGYYTGLSHLVVLDNQVGANNPSTRSADLFVTGGTGRAAGLELLLQKRSGALRGWLGYTLGGTQRTFAELNQGRSFAPKYDRRHDLSLVASWRHRAWTLESTLVYATGQAFTPATARYSLRNPATGEVQDYVLPAGRNSARLLPYHRLDLGARRSFALLGNQAEFYVQIFNTYSRRNEWFVQYDASRADTRPKVFSMLPVLPTFGLSLSF
ncbi:MAG: TonB-dependent receptor [Candidatus Latescibacteria bacterium]|nr:TonB-dependent receptor [Candidatus Latescibacterota bacterium]